ncbi:ABC transporter permease [Actinoallomurus soli]|uniref:ABC transporter permease n=1 Tax=Actinoallomurus soli TaxID=2952535 RepID=UPI002091FC46|nr:ABC transporter permease [Actinoallomurus soli]MCO5967659.1 ABC transporter permease [Actinoallomurus soli]
MAGGAAPSTAYGCGLAAELRAARMVWQREMLHFLRDRIGTLVSLLQSLMSLFILGVGMGGLFAGSGVGSASDYLTFLFPGVLVLAAQPATVAVGASIVWDREDGFLREMLVAPVHRATLLIGRCLGGMTVATCQGLVILAGAGLLHIPYRPGIFGLLTAELALTSLTLTVLATTIAVFVRRPRTLTAVLGVLMAPLLFLSGTMFPISALPGWLSLLSRLDPLTYAVDAMRRTVGVDRLVHGRAMLTAPVTWGGLRPAPPVELAVVAAFTMIALVVAARRFSRLG